MNSAVAPSPRPSRSAARRSRVPACETAPTSGTAGASRRAPPHAGGAPAGWAPPPPRRGGGVGGGGEPRKEVGGGPDALGGRRIAPAPRPPHPPVLDVPGRPAAAGE